MKTFRSMRIGILGTRGIPNRYGGFEECAEKLSLGLKQKGHEVWVYNSSHHEYKDDKWQGVNIVHCKDPEPKLGTAGQFIYDYNCFTDARRRKFDVLLQLGYTSSSIWWWRWPKDCINMVNMDGLEWKRSKFSPRVQQFLKKAERWAALHADVLIADSTGIQKYLEEKYRRSSSFIPYGATLLAAPHYAVLKNYGITPGNYHLLIARMEPENNIEMIIRGYIRSGADVPMVVVGNTSNKHGSYLKEKYGSKIKFTEGIYDSSVIDSLRYYSRLYWHGHSVGGTNPSLLEAMACHALIAAHRNSFNDAVLSGDAFSFSNEEEVAEIISTLNTRAYYTDWLNANDKKIHDRYNWLRIVDDYEQAMLLALESRTMPSL